MMELTQSHYPIKPWLAGFWLIGFIPLAGVVVGLFETFVHRPDIGEVVGIPVIALAGFTVAFLWGRSLIRRSGFEITKQIGIASGLAFPLAIMGVYAGFEPIFESIMQIFGIPTSGPETSEQFFVIFVTWTGIVTGVCGLAIGLGLKDIKLAGKLLGIGFVTGAVVFYIVAFVMHQLGFQVGTPRPDGLPSMPVVTLLGIWAAALVGSEVFGRVLAGSAPSVAEARAE